MSDDETTRTPSQQPESSAGPAIPVPVSSDSGQNVETPVATPGQRKSKRQGAAPMEKESQQPKEKPGKKAAKPRAKRACDLCARKKIRCIHGVNSTTASPETVRSAQSAQPPEEPSPKRLRRTTRRPAAHDDVIEYSSAPAEPAAQPTRKAAASRKGKRGYSETEEPAAGASVSTNGAEPAQRGMPSAAQSLGEIAAVKWTGSFSDTFKQCFKGAEADWKEWKASVEVCHDKFVTLEQSMSRVDHVIEQWRRQTEVE